MGGKEGHPKGYVLEHKFLVKEGKKVAGIELWRKKNGRMLVAVVVTNREYLKENFDVDLESSGLEADVGVGERELEERLVRRGTRFLLVLHRDSGYFIPQARIEDGRICYEDFLFMAEKEHWENLI